MAQQYPPPQYPPPQYPPQYPQYPPPAPSTSTAAVISLIASILGIIGFLPIIGSLIGVIAGNSAKSDIRNRPGQVTGDGLAQAGVVIGWIGLALWGLGICAFMVLGGIPLVLGLCAALSSGQTSMLPVLPAVGLVISFVLARL
jgi:hypothetical protein